MPPRGSSHTPEAKAKIGAASRARVTDEMRERGRMMCRTVFAERKRVTFTPEMTHALQSMIRDGRNQEEMAVRIGVSRELISREMRALADAALGRAITAQRPDFALAALKEPADE